MNAEEKVYYTIDELFEDLEKPIPWYREVYYSCWRGWKTFKMIPRQIRWFVQRGKRGYAEYDVWNFDTYLARVMLGGIEWHIENRMGHPARLSDEQWGDVLGKIKLGLSMYCNTSSSFDTADAWQKPEVKEAFRLLVEFFPDLWD